ncbi:unnamed protein product [Medioppia subpectinata]|uniref:Phosphoinositide phospholipase C n=1 Tax=Medioppia subpectinata TaxID=1979941 RepID=A0A7R9KMI2_9ACAR|nr:unnamed protein product [Medioppia subpectinata]CAG2106000.1 unnamed protein product [Medioppia subpectinata]
MTTKSEGFAKANDEKYVKFTKNHLVRTYPKGTRTASSNYNPIPHWIMGSQLVALNYQTPDKPMLLNEALFAMNGKCGYVLKSDYLRKGQLNDTNDRSLTTNAGKIKSLSIKLLSGQHIPKPGNSQDGEVVDPYVKFRVYGHPLDNNWKSTTAPVKNNGFNPVWNESPIEFIIRCPEMAFIYIAVKDHSATGKDVLLGQYMLAFPAIMEGYRTIYLVDSDHQSLSPASLLVHIAIKDAANESIPE